MDVSQIDAKVFALIATGTMAVIGAVKKAFPKWVVGKEELLALALPVVFVIVAKLCGGIHNTAWVDALVKAVGAGIGAGVAYDYVVAPVVKGNDDKAVKA